MAENINALILPIGADPSQFEKSIKEVKDAYSKLAQEIQSKPFNLISAKDKENLSGFARTIQSLEGNLATATDGTKKARIALNSLSLVAQDAPFGFIGIQNNLPAVIQAFSQLTSQSGGLKGALSEIGKSLVGPAGLFLAFSVVTSAITFLVKEYGSLNNAIKAFISGNSAAVKSQNEFNKAYQDSAKSIGGEEAQIKVLTQTLLSENSTQKQRLEAYRLLKQINPDVVAGINEQNLATDKSRRLIEAAAKVQIEYIKLRAQEGAILKALDNLKEQEFQANGKLNKAKENEIKLAERIAIINKKKKARKILTGRDINTLKQQNLITEEYQKEVTDARAEVIQIKAEQDKWTGSLGKSYARIAEISSGVKTLNDDLNEYEKSLKEASKFQLEIEPQNLDKAFNLDKIISDLTKYGNVLLDISKNELDRKNALKELVAINPQVFSALTLEKNGLLANKQTIEEYNRSLEVLIQSRKDDARASEINTQFRNAQLKSQDAAVKAEEDAFDSLVKLTYGQDQYGNSTDKSTKANNKFVESLGELQDIDQGVIDILTKGLGIENTYEKAIKGLLNFEEYQKSAVDRITKNFRFLQNPLEDLFGSVLEDGIANWQAFGDAVVSEIKKIAAALLANSKASLIS
jgi:hypothetical protein